MTAWISVERIITAWISVKGIMTSGYHPSRRNNDCLNFSWRNKKLQEFQPKIKQFP
jgi:hypothetical protein